MQPEQRVIAKWIQKTADRLGWSYGHWAKEAGIGAGTTITRALKEDYESVTSVKTLHALATAAGTPSILDLLEDQAEGREARDPSAAVPNVETLETLLSAVLPLAPRGRTTAQSVRVVASALQHGLELLGDHDAKAEPGSLGVAARGAVSRLRSLTQQ